MRNFWLLCLLSVYISLVPQVSSAEERQSPIIVEADPVFVERKTLPLLGFRSTSESFISGKFVLGEPANSTAYYIPEEIIKTSVQVNPFFQKFLRDNGMSGAELQPTDIKRLAQSEFGSQVDILNNEVSSI